MVHPTSTALQATGFVELQPALPLPPSSEWQNLHFQNWRSAGITRYAPLTSFDGSLQCNAFWNQSPPRADQHGIWVDDQVDKAPGLVGLAVEPGAEIGRCRVSELQPNSYADGVYNLHLDDNNRLNPKTSPRIIRGLIQLTDDPDSLLLLRTDRFDPATEVRIPLRAGTRIVLDSERIWHAVWHRGQAPRYALVVSWTCGPELDAYLAENALAQPRVPLVLDQRLIDDAQVELLRRLEQRRAEFAALTDSLY